jgi:hypothetical protein
MINQFQSRERNSKKRSEQKFGKKSPSETARDGKKKEILQRKRKKPKK